MSDRTYIIEFQYIYAGQREIHASSLEEALEKEEVLRNIPSEGLHMGWIASLEYLTEGQRIPLTKGAPKTFYLVEWRHPDNSSGFHITETERQAYIRAANIILNQIYRTVSNSGHDDAFQKIVDDIFSDRIPQAIDSWNHHLRTRLRDTRDFAVTVHRNVRKTMHEEQLPNSVDFEYVKRYDTRVDWPTIDTYEQWRSSSYKTFISGRSYANRPLYTVLLTRPDKPTDALAHAFTEADALRIAVDMILGELTQEYTAERVAEDLTDFIKAVRDENYREAVNLYNAYLMENDMDSSYEITDSASVVVSPPKPKLVGSFYEEVLKIMDKPAEDGDL